MYNELEELVGKRKVFSAVCHWSTSYSIRNRRLSPLPKPPTKEMKVEQDLEIQWEMQEEVLFYNKFALCLLFGVGKNCCYIWKAGWSRTQQV